MKYLQSSTVKSGFQKANNLAFCRLNALSSAKGTGIRTANSFAVLRLNALSSAKGIKAPKSLGFLLYGILRNIAQPDVARGHSHATTSHDNNGWNIVSPFSGPRSGELHGWDEQSLALRTSSRLPIKPKAHSNDWAFLHLTSCSIFSIGCKK